MSKCRHKSLAHFLLFFRTKCGRCQVPASRICLFQAKLSSFCFPRWKTELLLGLQGKWKMILFTVEYCRIRLAEICQHMVWIMEDDRAVAIALFSNPWVRGHHRGWTLLAKQVVSTCSKPKGLVCFLCYCSAVRIQCPVLFPRMAARTAYYCLIFYHI